jgi:hypothetical protein
MARPVAVIGKTHEVGLPMDGSPESLGGLGHGGRAGTGSLDRACAGHAEGHVSLGSSALVQTVEATTKKGRNVEGQRIGT